MQRGSVWKEKSFPACLKRDELWICFSLTPVCPKSKNSPPHTAPPHTKHLLTSPQSLSQPRMGTPAPFWKYHHHYSYDACLQKKWVATFSFMEHLTVLGQMVSFLVLLLHSTFSSLLCSSFYCSPQSGSCLILVSKPTATVHFLLFGPWQMVTRYYGTNSSEVDWNFYSSFPSWILGASVSHTFPSYNFHCILYSSTWHAPYPWNTNSNRILSNAPNRRELPNLC